MPVQTRSMLKRQQEQLELEMYQLEEEIQRLTQPQRQPKRNKDYSITDDAMFAISAITPDSVSKFDEILCYFKKYRQVKPEEINVMNQQNKRKLYDKSVRICGKMIRLNELLYNLPNKFIHEQHKYQLTIITILYDSFYNYISTSDDEKTCIKLLNGYSPNHITSLLNYMPTYIEFQLDTQANELIQKIKAIKNMLIDIYCKIDITQANEIEMQTYTTFQQKIRKELQENFKGSPLKEKLMAVVWHPRNFEKFKYLDPEEFGEVFREDFE